MNKFLYLFLFCFKVISAVIYKLPDAEYDLMPPIFKADPFDSCLKEPRGVYCTTYLTYVSDEDSPLLHMMQEFSAHTVTHYNHTRALYGTCITKTCMHLYKGKTKKELTTVLEACLNETLWEEYKLKVVTEELSCSFEDEDQVEIQWSYIIVAGVCLSIVLLNIIGSIYDTWYIKNDPDVVSQLLLCFSISRNWKKLTSLPATTGDPRLPALKSIHGYRGIFMILVIGTHSFLPMLLLTRTPRFIESIYEYPGLQIFINGTVVMQIFFIMSSFLLMYNLLLTSEKYQLTWSLLPRAILKRWLRLTPPLAMVLAVTATWLRYFGSGPVWDKFVEVESRACESEWWHQILFINNYVDGSLCMPQMWYLAADFQLYIIGVIVVIVCRAVSPKKVLPILFVIGLIVPALHTYFQDLDGTLIFSPTLASSFFTVDATFNHVYKRGHTNLAGSVIGLAAGYLVYHLQRSTFDVSKYRRYRPLYWAILPACFVEMYSCRVYYADAPRAGLLHRVLVSAVIRPVYAVFMATLLVGMILKLESVYRSTFEWNGWTTLSRVSYSAYLVHLLIIRSLAGLQMDSLQGTFVRMTEFVVCALTLTYLVAYLFWLTVESPLSQLVAIIVEGKGRNTPQKEKKENCLKIN